MVMTKVMTKTATSEAAKITMVAKGDGLYLKRRGSSNSWVFRYQSAGKRHDVHIGVEEHFTLREAKEVVRDMHRALARGDHPRTVLNKPDGDRTLAHAVDQFIEVGTKRWRGKMERKHTENQLRHHLGHLLARPVSQIHRDDILDVLRKVTSSPSVYDRLLYRVRSVFLREGALGHLARQPIEWGGLRQILTPTKVKVEHHPATPWQDAPAVWSRLAPRMTPAAICLKLTILTAVRSGEARGASWPEFDFDHKTWTIPEERTKTGNELVVPLSTQLIQILSVMPVKNGPLLFPGRTGKPLSDMGLLKEQRLLDPVATVHGWRSTFKDWGRENELDRELVELSLGHAFGDKVEQAYARSRLVERRRPIAQAWADHVTGATA